MRRLARLTATTIVIATAVLVSATARAVPGSGVAATPVATPLHALFDKAWQAAHATAPSGSTDYKLLWGDPGIAHEQHMAALAKGNLAALHRINPAQLDPTDQLSYRLFEYQLEDAIAGSAWPNQAQGLISQLWGPQLAGEEFNGTRRANAQSYADLIRKLEALGPYLDAFSERLRLAARQGITQPRVAMQRVTGEISANIVADPTQSPFYEPFQNLPDSISATEQARLQAEARTAIAKVVTPAYRRFRKFFQSEYLPRARTAIGVSNLADGRVYYSYLVRHYTTTDMTPAEVHALGLRLVTSIHGQMQAVFAQIGFQGSYKEFLHHLRSDPKFYYTDPDDLLMAYRAATKRVDPHLVDVLGTWLLPRVPYGVHPIPAALAPNTYPAYAEPPARDGSRAGYVGVNLYKPETRPKYSIQVLMCHEGRPGHELQIPVANQLDNLPDFRRYAYYDAFGEGWALYSEVLCDQPMNLYTDPYAKFGYLNYQMWRAVRLVVDTGIHEYGWTREQAVHYMQDNTALADQNLATEVDRYIVWPGQALSYMIGEQEILALRGEAQRKLGDRYTLRDFNNVVLGQGSLPMAVLREVVNLWIDNTLAGKPADQLPYACQPRSVQSCGMDAGNPR